MARTVILGAGIAGHTAALHLRRMLPKEHDVVVVAPNANWNWIPSNIWVGVGRMSQKKVVFPLAPVYRRKGIEFHQALVSACGSKALLDLHAGIYERYLRYQMVFFIFWGPTSTEDHKALLDCALNRDAVRAQKLLHGHIHGCIAMALERGLVG